jgi:hypothetical protein
MPNAEENEALPAPPVTGFIIGGQLLTRMVSQVIRQEVDSTTLRLFFFSNSQCSVSAQGHQHPDKADQADSYFPQLVSAPMLMLFLVSSSSRHGIYYYRICHISEYTILYSVYVMQQSRTSINPACFYTKPPPITPRFIGCWR